jgi:hypothetical protein
MAHFCTGAFKSQTGKKLGKKKEMRGKGLIGCPFSMIL